MGRFVDSGFEFREARAKRVGRALDDKCPKLAAWARGGEGLLILESNDIALSNAHEIADAVIAGLTTRNDAPDRIILVESEMLPTLVV